MQTRASLWSFSAILFSICVDSVRAGSTPPSNPYRAGRLPQPANPLEVNLGYAGYTGVYNASLDLNYWYGIPYAQAPIGELRWQRSIPPQTSFNGTFFNASTTPRECPQAPDHIDSPEPAWKASTSQSEDCLFLNVWAPPNATGLPVFVWIHGGGYGSGSATVDMQWLIDKSVTKFIGVSIQYRLGAFGFLASNDVQQYGTANAGLHDQYLALQWVQKYISLFGGDPDRVTIAGESAGGGSVMLQAMAYGGAVGDALFDGIFPASPYLPQQYNFDDSVPIAAYNAFATEAGCANITTGTVFDCLVAADTDDLQAASYTVTIDAKYGEWAFLPVTDGTFTQQRPSVQLTSGRVNGNRGLIGNNANEAVGFTPQNITTEDDFVAFVKYVMPQLNNKQVQELLAHYPLPEDLSTARFATDGLDDNATAVFVSPWAVGQQQRANNLYAETTFVCSAYWLADAYSRNGGHSYKYQFSLVNSLHGEDLAAYVNHFGYLPDTMSPTFQDSFISFLTSFITSGTPRNSSSYTSDTPADIAEFLTAWPTYSTHNPLQANLNQTGGVLTTGADIEDPYDIVIRSYLEPGLVPNFSMVNAHSWEGGRGARCDFLKSIGAVVPEKK